MKKAFIVGGVRFSENRVLGAYGFSVTHDIEQANLVVLTGGADIGPHLYNQPTHMLTSPQPHRDAEDQKGFVQAQALGIPMLGICRGAQFLCAMAGGTLYQDITKHAGTNHNIINKATGEVMLSNSVHHQAMIPPEDAIIHYVATHECVGTRWDAARGIFIIEGVEEVAEIVTFPSINAVAVQGHPEFDSGNPELMNFRKTVFSLVEGLKGI